MANPYQGIRGRLASWLGASVNAAGVRDLYTQFGYPQRILAVDYMEMYLRNGIASRVVRAFPSSTWGEQPVIRDEAGDSDEEGSKSYSPFVDAVNQFMDKFRVMQYMERADRLSSIGQFGVLYMGFADGLLPSQPVVTGKNQLLYLAAYGEPNLKIAGWETSILDPRFGLPTLYTCMTGSFQERMSVRRSFAAHYSRVLHVAEMLDQDEVYSTPTLMPVYNWLKDLEKVVGSSAESFWLNARGGLVLSADKDARIDAGALSDMKQQLTDYQQQITRTLALQGTTADLLQAVVANPQPNVEKLMDLIAGAKGIPKRILMGSERADLSSTQDEQNYSSKVGERRKSFAGPTMLQPFIQTMIDTDNLPEPKGRWWIEWPDTNALGPAAQADIAVKRSQSLAAYVNGIGSDLVVPVQEFRSEFLGLPSEPDAALGAPSEEPLDEKDPNVQAAFSGLGTDGAPLQTGDAPAQDQALNGAQIAAIAAIVQAVVDKTLPPESAIKLILVSFPSLDQATAEAMINPAIDFEAPVEPPKVVTIGPDGNPVPPVPPQDGQTPAKTPPEPAEPAAKAVANLVQRAVSTANLRLRANSAPRTLYVSRPVTNGDAIRAHYRDQGLDAMLPADKMHVTIAYSTTAVDWTKMPSDWNYSPKGDGTMTVQPGGMRMTDMFGADLDTLVLCFASSDLAWRWMSLREGGCSWGWGDDYSPHVTITSQPLPSGVDPKKIVPYQGAIEFGPEVWSEIVPNWADGVTENLRRLQP